jgi:hypothetical protein
VVEEGEPSSERQEGREVGSLCRSRDHCSSRHGNFVMGRCLRNAGKSKLVKLYFWGTVCVCVCVRAGVVCWRVRRSAVVG